MSDEKKFESLRESDEQLLKMVEELENINQITEGHLESMNSKIEALELKFQNTPSLYNMENKMKDVQGEIAELKEEDLDTAKCITGLVSDDMKIRKVLREHLKGHLRVYELIDSVEKPVDVAWKEHLQEQLEKLDGEKASSASHTEDTTELQTDPEWEKVRQEYHEPKEAQREDFDIKARGGGGDVYLGYEQDKHFCPICGNEITDIEKAMLEFHVIVRREALQKMVDWLDCFFRTNERVFNAVVGISNWIEMKERLPDAPGKEGRSK